jgi:hypothetical protein
MSKQTFKDGSTLLTGNDMQRALEAMLNRRGAYDIDCSFCVHEYVEDICDECSIGTDMSCSCHINPPCSKCERSSFEVTPYLLNFEQHEKGSKKWHCIKGDKETYNKLAEIENLGFHISTEILQTNEIALYIEDGNIDYEIEISGRNRAELRKKLKALIMNFSLSTKKREAF